MQDQALYHEKEENMFSHQTSRQNDIIWQWYYMQFKGYLRSSIKKSEQYYSKCIFKSQLQYAAANNSVFIDDYWEFSLVKSLVFKDSC